MTKRYTWLGKDKRAIHDLKTVITMALEDDASLLNDAAETVVTERVATDLGTPGSAVRAAVVDAIGSRLYDARDYGASSTSADNITAINDAITAAAADVAANGGSARVVVGAGTKTYAVRPNPATSHYIKLATGVTLDLSDVTLRVADDTPPYDYLISAATPATAIERVNITGGMIDLNPTGNTTADINLSTTRGYGLALYNARHVRIHETEWLGGGVNTITINGTGCYDIDVSGNRIRFARGNSAITDYDNSSVYLNARNMRVHDNTFLSSLAEGARGAVELHGTGATVSGNTSEYFKTLVHIVTGSTGGDTVMAPGSMNITGNVANAAMQAVLLWPLTGETLRDVAITGNIINIAQNTWNTAYAQGIGAQRSLAVDGVIDGLTVASNIIRFEDVDTRTGLDVSTNVGINPVAAGTTYHARITDNQILDSPGYGIRLGDLITGATCTLDGAEIENNTIIDAGRNTSSAAGTRAALALAGNVYRTRIRRTTIRDTGTPSNNGAYSITTASMWSGIDNQMTDTEVITASGVALSTSLNQTYLNINMKRIALDFPSIAAGASDTLDVTVPGVKLTDIIVAQPMQGIEDGLDYVVWAQATDTVRVRVRNTTAAAIDPANKLWRFRVIRNEWVDL